VTKKWIAINLMLLLGAGLLGWQLKGAIESFKAANNIAKIQPARKKAGPENARPPAQPPQKYNEAQFSAIYNQNLFAQSRKLDEPENANQQPEARELQNPPILVGAMIAGSKKTALIIDTSSQSGLHKTQTMQIGDMYQGFTIADITERDIVLEYGASRKVIPLSDTSKPAQMGKTPILQTRIVSFGAPVGGGQGANAGGIGVFNGGNNRAGAAQVGGARGNPQQVVPMQQPAGARGANQPAQQTAVSVGQGNLYPNQFINAQNQIITNTPFGQIVTQPVVPTLPQQPVKK
jgi:hypothetical protein